MAYLIPRVIALAALLATACFSPTYEEGIGCSETGACPPGMVCDSADNRCRSRATCGMDSECASGVCDQGTGMCVAGCNPETCTAGPCQTARCDGDMCVVESVCGSAQMCCAGECVAAGCEDGDPATDDVCGASGCEHTPNTGAACDDSMYCNGTDTYIDGVCEGHAGNPCSAPLVCDENIDMCVNCSASVPCPEPELGAWSVCGGFGDVCDSSGTRSRTVTTYTCQNAMCEPIQTIETQPCTRTTEGTSCGSTTIGSWGACGGFDAICDESGTQTRDVTAYTCVSDLCTPMTTTESQACTRSTTGVSCLATYYGPWGECGGDACSPSSTRSRTVITYTCGNAMCGSFATIETEACTRDGALVPVMTSNTTPSGLVTRSGVYGSDEAWQAFDATNTVWLSNMYTSAVWIGYEWGGGTPKRVNSYEIKYANGSCCEQRGPKNWTLQGWNGSTWVTVDTVTNQTGWYSNPNRTFAVDSAGCYVKYRLYVTADNYNNLTYPITLVSIASLQLFGY